MKIPKEKPITKYKVIINLIIICVGFLLLFTAFQALANLQSSLNSEEGVGVASQSVIYAALILSSMFLPTFIIKKIGCKLTLVIAMVTYAPYIASNFYPKMATMLPCAAILGIGASSLWSAKCTYLNEIGFKYAALSNEEVDVVIARFFGIFFMFFQSSQIWGNLISWAILRPDNETVIIENTRNFSNCGANFHPNDNGTNPNLERPTDDKTNILIGVYLGCCILASVLVGIFLDPLERESNGRRDENISPKLLLATFRHLKQHLQVLLIPITIYSGIEQVFFVSEFTKAYVACAWGLHYIGFVAICFGVVNAIVSLTSGIMVKLVGRIPIFIVAATANVTTFISLLFWKPTSEEYIIFFVVAGVWGMADAVWQTQINAFYGVLFKENEEAAFSNYRMWESIGFSLAFAYSHYIHVAIKIYIAIGILIIGMIGYLMVEIQLYRRSGECELNSKE